MQFNQLLYLSFFLVLTACVNNQSIRAVEHHGLPTPIGPYNHSVQYDQLIFVSGQLGIDPKTAHLQDGVENQTRQIFKNLMAILKDNQSDLSHVTKTTIFLQNLKDYQQVNKIYGSYFKPPFPARSTIQVSALPADALIEIECTAVKAR